MLFKNSDYKVWSERGNDVWLCVCVDLQLHKEKAKIDLLLEKKNAEKSLQIFTLLFNAQKSEFDNLHKIRMVWLWYQHYIFITPKQTR